MRKPIAITTVALIFLAGYVAAIIYAIMPRWLVIGLAPFALLAAVVVLVMSGGYSILFTEAATGFLRRMKEKFLLKYGVETQAVLISAEMYHGPGLHEGDPCYKGTYQFTDLQGRDHTFEFSRECYDPYDLNSLDTPIDDHYKVGTKRRVLYWELLPFIHYLYGPDISVPVLRGKFGLYRME